MTGDFERRLTRLEERSEKYGIDLYEGKGRNDPSFNERLSLVEETVNKLNKNLSKIVWLIIATLVSVVAGLIFKH